MMKREKASSGKIHFGQIKAVGFCFVLFCFFSAKETVVEVLLFLFNFSILIT